MGAENKNLFVFSRKISRGKVEELLIFLRTLKNDCIFFGDFNIDTLTDDNEKHQYTNLLAAYGFAVQNNSPTRVTSTTATCLDHVISSYPIETETIKITISDHFALEASIPLLSYNREDKTTYSPKKFRSLKNLKGEKALNFLFILDQKLKALDMNNNLDDTLESLIQIIMECVNRFAPEKSYDHKPASSWITNKIKNEIKKRDKLFQKWIEDPSDDNRSKYKAIRNKITKEIKNAKREHNFCKLGTNPTVKKIYSSLKSHKMKNQPNHERPSVHTLNDYFTQIGPILSNKINVSYEDEIPRNLTSMVLTETTPNEVSKILKTLKNKYSTGPDGISNAILKCCSPIIETYLCTFINRCIREQVFPQQLKIAKVIALYKKDNKLLPENYRPISLLSTISKIFEKVIYKQMYSFFTKNKLFSSNQFGFREKRSCIHAVCEVTDYIRSKIDERSSGNACFIDIKKAFDTIDHKILLFKIEKYGFRGPIYNLMSNYLSDRWQYVIHDEIKSTMKSIVTGVPQGSILGPFLFLLYINDLPSTCKNSKISLFADDTSVCNMNKNSENEITDDIQRITSWFKRNKLTVNTEKCESIGFRNAPPVNEIAFGQKVELKNSCKYLGILFDCKLDFKNHIKMVTKKLNRFCGLIYKIQELYPRKCLTMFYNSYAKSIISYGLLAYGGTTKTSLELIEKAQRRIFRAMYFKKQSDSLLYIMEENQLQTVFELYINELLHELINEIRGNSPFNFLKSFFVPAKVNTRSKVKGLIPSVYTRTKLYQRSLKISILKLYNWLKENSLLPENIEKMSKASCSALIKKINCNYITNNRDLHNLFY